MKDLVRLWWVSLPDQAPSSSASVASSTSSHASATRTRDKDLILTDRFLTDDVLDELWAWFCDAAQDGVDPQLMFVKMVNSARKPYVDHLTAIKPPTPATPGGDVNDIVSSWRRGSSTSTACYTPSKRTVTEHEFDEPVRNLQAHQTQQTTITQLRHENGQLEGNAKSLTSTITQLRHENGQLENNVSLLTSTTTQLRFENEQLEYKVKSLSSTITNTIPPPPLRIAIKSVQFGSRYVCMNGSDVRSYLSNGGGCVNVQTHIHNWETFELVCHPGKHNIVSFKSICFDNVYLRADACCLSPGQTPREGGGIVNCQYGCGGMESFRISKVRDQGWVTIEPVEFPGRFLKLNGNWLHGMKLQGKADAGEKFYLVIVP
ncbi:hypothetical protein EV426DRAFT_720195 [Tirmania nivea]|nr:hypothetical protein EV426DRAFT_720195 [Tirmania nivea]